MTGLRVTQYQTEEFNAGSRKKNPECHIKAPPLRREGTFFFPSSFSGRYSPVIRWVSGDVVASGSRRRKPFRGTDSWGRKKKNLASEHTRCTTPTPSCSCCRKDDKIGSPGASRTVDKTLLTGQRSYPKVKPPGDTAGPFMNVGESDALCLALAPWFVFSFITES